VIELNDEVAKLAAAAVDAEEAHRGLTPSAAFDAGPTAKAPSTPTPPMAPACGGLLIPYVAASTVCAVVTASSANRSRRSTTTP